MINGAHVVVYSKNAEADRAFLKEVLKFSFVDVHGGRGMRGRDDSHHDNEPELPAAWQAFAHWVVGQ